MAKINQDLIDRLKTKLGVGQAAVYARIARVAGDRMLDRQHAALVVATENGINIHKYSTAEERAEARAILSGGGGRQESSEAPRREPGQRRPTKSAKKAKRKVKDNTIFVVYGRDSALRKSMFEFLRALGLDPKEWNHVLREARGNNPFIGNALDEVMEKAQAVVVMFTPDDLAQ
ncbi:MAG: nucleotide-binding protein, partial [Beijerinckiaceae bacterium]|nr:nucleotide-binding protein [Beijerinckiaceae bacterium]